MKNSFPFLILILIIAACSQTGSKKIVPADNKNINLVGRFDLSDKASPVFMYSGSLIRTDFNGTSIEVILKDDSLRNMFNVLIDDSMFVLTTNKPDGVYPLAGNLKDGKHSLEIHRRTEWHGGNTIFKGFNLDRGSRLYKPSTKTRIIEFIGDSYTCGYGNEGRSREGGKLQRPKNPVSRIGRQSGFIIIAVFYFLPPAGTGAECSEPCIPWN